ncbi:MAG TPA: hypothetical protein VGJ28_15720, partial [Micromonosporaceae bacterium]
MSDDHGSYDNGSYENNGSYDNGYAPIISSFPPGTYTRIPTADEDGMRQLPSAPHLRNGGDPAYPDAPVSPGMPPLRRHARDADAREGRMDQWPGRPLPEPRLDDQWPPREQWSQQHGQASEPRRQIEPTRNQVGWANAEMSVEDRTVTFGTTTGPSTTGRPPSMAATSVGPIAGRTPMPRVNYEAVRLLRGQVGESLTRWLRDQHDPTEDEIDREREQISEEVVAKYADKLRNGGTPLTGDDEYALLIAVRADMVGLGRLQALLTDATIEEVHIL